MLLCFPLRIALPVVVFSQHVCTICPRVSLLLGSRDDDPSSDPHDEVEGFDRRRSVHKAPGRLTKNTARRSGKYGERT